MTKKLLLLLTWSLLNSCSPPSSIAPALRIAGSYKLTEYTTNTKSGLTPSGFVTVLPVDDQHVNLVVKGTYGKTKITYSYQNVVVSDYGRNYLGEDSYSLSYKKAQLGVISSDERGHYITLSPKPAVTLIAESPPVDL